MTGRRAVHRQPCSAASTLRSLVILVAAAKPAGGAREQLFQLEQSLALSSSRLAEVGHPLVQRANSDLPAVLKDEVEKERAAEEVEDDDASKVRKRGNATSVALAKKATPTKDVAQKFKVNKGMHCVGSKMDYLAAWKGTPEECMQKCVELQCSGFVRINKDGDKEDGHSFSGMCWFRRGKLSVPQPWDLDQRDCYVSLLHSSYTGCSGWSPPDGPLKGIGASCNTWGGFTEPWCYTSKEFADTAQETDVHESMLFPGHYTMYCEMPEKVKKIESDNKMLVGYYKPEDIMKDLLSQEISHDRELKSGLLVAALLMGFVVFDMTVLYLLNASDPQVKAYSFKLLSSCIVVFLSLDIEALQVQVGVLILYICGVDAEKSMADEFVQFLLFLGWYASISFAAVRYRNKHLDLYAALGICLHVPAFIALETTGHLQEHKAEHMHEHHHAHDVEADHHGHGRGIGKHYHTDLVLLYVLTPIAVFLICKMCSLVMRRWREQQIKEMAELPEEEQQQPMDEPDCFDRRDSLASMRGEMHGHGDLDHRSGHHEDHWLHEVQHAEIDCSAISFGFLAKQGMLYLVTSQVALMDCSEHPVVCRMPLGSSLTLLFISLVIYAALMFISIKSEAFEIYAWKVVATEATMHMGMVFAWLLLQWGTMTIYKFLWDSFATNSLLHATTTTKLITASLMSPLFVVLILLLDRLADYRIIDEAAAESSVSCFALVIGLYWEKTFSSAIHSVSEMFTMMHCHCGEKSFIAMSSDILLKVGLVAIIVPAWRWFIVPVAALPVPLRDYERAELREAYVDRCSAKANATIRAAKQLLKTQQRRASAQREEEDAATGSRSTSTFGRRGTSSGGGGDAAAAAAAVGDSAALKLNAAEPSVSASLEARDDDSLEPARQHILSELQEQVQEGKLERALANAAGRQRLEAETTAEAAPAASET
eukprot:TRINITY_DN11749_c0_g1_i2.p1 TRINITY_DN11749_c0_g1~~TRINITY_DN11749_c0_g1_i2.p1  ORF type:complete len:937 (-),score=259.79 TRINITY_DN11749_c0_g1_i2:121-2931(-)